uniref:LacI family DNA-binding transcriptional regulator n=1 Tax=Microbacterium sp. TaxID=51671 RepID=UPI0028112023
DGTDVDTVRADSAKGMALVVDHLADAGRRRIAFLNGPADTTPGRVRQEGFRRAVEARAIASTETVARDFTIAEGYRAARELLEAALAAEAPQLPDAIVAANDLIGIGAIHAADDLGLRVPEDIAVTGVDDTELAVVSRPGLTSVDLGAAERGRVAAELLVARLAEPDRPAHSVTVAPSLRVRGSSQAGLRALTGEGLEVAG